MSRNAYHPNAYLSRIKNIRLGLKARTKILDVLERKSVDGNALAIEATMHYGVIMHHLKLLEAEEIVERKGRKPYVWVLTGVGQRRLVDSA